MKLAILVNRVDELVPTMTTHMLVDAALRRGHSLCLVEIDGLELEGERVYGRARSALDAAPVRVALDDCDAFCIRTNPARDTARADLHGLALDVARLLRDRGVAVVNDPDGIVRAASKLGLARLPEALVPWTGLTRDPDSLRRWAAERGQLVIKPVRGTRGQGVERFGPDDDAERALAGGPRLVQSYLPEATDGDVRLVLVDGEPLVVDGALGAIRRRPAPGDFRSNLHAGGSPEPVPELTPRMREIAERLRPWLVAEGLWLVGVDLVGDRVIELNVYSTGGLFHARRFAGGADFAGEVVARLETRAR